MAKPNPIYSSKPSAHKGISLDISSQTVHSFRWSQGRYKQTDQYPNSQRKYVKRQNLHTVLKIFILVTDDSDMPNIAKLLIKNRDNSPVLTVLEYWLKYRIYFINMLYVSTALRLRYVWPQLLAKCVRNYVWEKSMPGVNIGNRWNWIR